MSLKTLMDPDLTPGPGMFACALHRSVRTSWSSSCKKWRDSAEHMYPGIFAQSRHLAVSLESQAGCLSSWTAHFCFRLQCPIQFGSYILWLPPALGCCWEGGMAARAGSAESLCWLTPDFDLSWQLIQFLFGQLQSSPSSTGIKRKL